MGIYTEKSISQLRYHIRIRHVWLITNTLDDTHLIVIYGNNTGFCEKLATDIGHSGFQVNYLLVK